VEVSITVCVRNGAQFIDECLDALVQQSHRPIEIIVVDDGSSDSTSKLLEPWEDEEGTLRGISIRVIRTEAKGLSSARNTALLAAKYPLVATTDIDCRPRSMWISELVRHWTESKDKLAAVTGRTIFQRGATTTSRLRAGDIARKYVGRGRKTSLANGPCSMYDRALLISSGGFEPHWYHAEDMEASLRLTALGGQIEYVPTALVDHVAESQLRVFLKKRIRDARGHVRIMRKYGKKSHSEMGNFDFLGKSWNILWSFPFFLTGIMLLFYWFFSDFSHHLPTLFPHPFILLSLAILLLIVDSLLLLFANPLPLINSTKEERIIDLIFSKWILRAWSFSLWMGAILGWWDGIRGRHQQASLAEQKIN